VYECLQPRDVYHFAWTNILAIVEEKQHRRHIHRHFDLLVMHSSPMRRLQSASEAFELSIPEPKRGFHCSRGREKDTSNALIGQARTRWAKELQTGRRSFNKLQMIAHLSATLSAHGRGLDRWTRSLPVAHGPS
jgi:hypothetical protein